ncbi:MAG: SH3 domain-containing protein [Chloroflexota bacterium]|jgi:uncharacterized protein YgiM (DUF1202 family)
MAKFQSSHRRWAVIVLVLLMLLVVGQVAAAAGQAGYPAVSPQLADGPVAIVSTGALNVRTGPAVSYHSIAVIYQGQSVDLLGRWASSSWVLIRLWNGTEGWVNSYYLQTSVPVTDLPVVGAPPPQPTPVPPPTGAMAVVNTGALNVRTGPAPTYPSQAVVFSGQQLPLVGRNGAATWAKVQLPNGAVGWVNAYYVLSNVAIGTLPLADEPAPEPDQLLGLVSSGAVNVRSGPGAQYTSIAVLTGGTNVGLLGRNADASWIKVHLSNGAEGWIRGTLLLTDAPIWTLAIVEAPPPANGAVVNIGALNVRYGPSTGYGVFAVVYRGQVVNMVGRSAYGTWAQVRIPSGALGWVNSNYLLSDVPYDSLPVTGP